ncbi:hypothetical protein ACHAXT_000013 [Thalassiosira profunda]
MRSTLLLLAAAPASAAAAAASHSRASADLRSLHAFEMPCLTQWACQDRAGEVGAASFHVVQGAPTKGCTAKNGRVFWSPGTEEEMSTVEATGTSVRLWCDGHPEPSAAPSATTVPTGSPIAPTGRPSLEGSMSPSVSKAPTPKPTTRSQGVGSALTAFSKDFACTTRAACAARSREMGLPFRVVKGTESKGCFTKNGNAFWALGFEDEMSKPELPGVQARLWCAYSGEAPLPAAGDTTDTNGTVAAGGSPAGSPTAEKWEIQEGTPPSTGPGQVSECVLDL